MLALNQYKDYQCGHCTKIACKCMKFPYLKKNAGKVERTKVSQNSQLEPFKPKENESHH